MVQFSEKEMEQPNRFYILVDDEKFTNERKDDNEFKINGCKNLRMLSFLPCGKENLCDCDDCNDGKLYCCKIEKGVIFSGSDDINSSDDSVEDGDLDNVHEHEEYEIPKSM